MFKTGSLVKYTGETNAGSTRIIKGHNYKVIQSTKTYTSVKPLDHLQREGVWSFMTKDFIAITSPILAKNSRKKTTLPLASKERKDFPLYSGLLQYFPAALTQVSYVSKIGNDKHNPGEPLHHSRGKSADHADCIMRHLLDMKENFGKGLGRDENGVPQVSYIAWRALALAQEWLEQNSHAPLAPAAKI